MKLWYNEGVPVKTEKKGEPLAMKVQPSTLKTVEKIAQIQDRPVGYVARELMIRGIAQYLKDGKLRDDEPDNLGDALRELRGELNKRVKIPVVGKTS